MRIAEKTAEINFCTGLAECVGVKLFWFGLTQKQEAQAGFDVCTRVHGRLLLFQMKVSAHVLKSGARRFHAPHDQMQALRNRVKLLRRSVFYVFPAAGTMGEVCGVSCFARCSQFLDVSQLPSTIPRPTQRNGSIRKSNVHYVDVVRGKATIHSEPFDVELLRSNELSDVATDGLNSAFENRFAPFWKFIRTVSRPGLVAAIAVV